MFPYSKANSEDGDSLLEHGLFVCYKNETMKAPWLDDSAISIIFYPNIKIELSSLHKWSSK